MSETVRMSALVPITALDMILPPARLKKMIEIKKLKGGGQHTPRSWAAYR